MTLLIVDDSATNLKLLRLQLEAEGYSVVEAENGIDALSALEAGPIDAIIADILMPRMDGFALCREIRQHERLKTIPFIVYTSTYNSPSDENMSFLVGADRYIVKPAPTEVLLRAVREVTTDEKYRQPRVAEPPDDLVVMREYNAVLVRKLKERNQDLERTQAELLRSNFKLQQQTEALGQLNAALEQRVAERTADLVKKNRELEQALAEVKQLRGILPICAHCKKIRDDKNYWLSVESYVMAHTDAKFSHGYCPECYEKVMKPQMEELRLRQAKSAGG